MADTVQVIFNRSFRQFNAGERAEFLPHTAADIVRTGAAAYADPGMALPGRTPEEIQIPRAQRDAEMRTRRLAALCETLDEGNPECWDKEGKPSVSYLGLLFGKSIFPADRDAAFIRANQIRKANGRPELGPRKSEAKPQQAGAKR